MKPQIEDMIIREAMFKALQWAVLILFTASLCFNGYLLSRNHNKAITIEEMEHRHYIDSLLLENCANVERQQDSIIDAMPTYVPTGWEVDSNGIFNPNF